MAKKKKAKSKAKKSKAKSKAKKNASTPANRLAAVARARELGGVAVERGGSSLAEGFLTVLFFVPAIIDQAADAAWENKHPWKQAAGWERGARLRK